MYNEVIDFWFAESTPKQWFAKSSEFDQNILRRFGETHQKAMACELYSWRVTAEGRLAEIIVLDQFSRNLYRDSADAFACDALALALAQEAVSLGADQLLTQTQRNFMYMPYMHSESAAIHEQALELFKNNGDSSTYDFELRHKTIIDRFGRYPHRNAKLGRTSTAEEDEFLQQSGSGF